MDVAINYWAVLVAAIASMVVGWLWYGVFFKRQWMALMGYNADSMKGMKMTANKAYLIQFIASFVMAYVLSHALVFASTYLQTSGASAGLLAGFWHWLGFIVPVSLGIVLWENKSWSLWLINASHYLVSLLVMGLILALWM